LTPAGGPPPQGLIISPSQLAVSEGGDAPFSVRLAQQPTSDVVVTISKNPGGDSDLTAATATLVFTSATWNVPQQVNVFAAQDADTLSGSAGFTISAAGVDAKVVNVTEQDDDGPAAPVVLRAVADTFVRDGSSPSTNFGTSTQLQLKNAGTGWYREAYLRFDLSQVSTVSSAKLRLFGKLDNTRSPAEAFQVLTSANTSWNETSVTYNTRLPSDNVVHGDRNDRQVVRGRPDVAPATAEGRRCDGVTLVLRETNASNSTILFDSDEGTNRPELAVS
jgi:hypothetical protein